MKKRKLQEFTHHEKFKICFDGFYDYNQFNQAIKIYTKEFGAICTNSSAGFYESASSVTHLDGIELQWDFDNWICIEISYSNNKDEIAKEKIRKWANVIFSKLIEEYGEYDNS